MSRENSEHRWVVDAIEETTARIEEDGARMIAVPRWLLPPDVREGECLAVTRAGAGGASVVTITVDVAATSAAREKSAKQVAAVSKGSRKRDPGGDVSL